LKKKIPKKKNIKIISDVIIMVYVARSIPNILDAMVLENINLSEDKIGRPPLWSNVLSSVAYIRCQQCIFQLEFHMYIGVIGLRSD
jgi:hypothetical protein